MSAVREAVEEYLTLRRGLGFKLRDPGTWLRQFATFLERHDATHITIRLALEWARQPAKAQPAYWTRRLSVVRGFAQYCSANDSRTEVPPLGLLPHRFHRKPPYIYTDEEIGRLLDAAGKLPSMTGLRSHTYTTLLGLLAVTGMRISEVVALQRDDVDFADALITIRRTKFGKSRLVPVHPSTRRALQRYAERRDRLHPGSSTATFFTDEHGGPVSTWAARRTFVRLSHEVGLRGPSDRRGPRLHDLRHRFAVKTLLGWYRAGIDVERHLPTLSTYLGHTHVTDTYWYLSAVPELMRLVVERLETGARSS
jgi:integrase/recombinase XerD